MDESVRRLSNGLARAVSMSVSTPGLRMLRAAALSATSGRVATPVLTAVVAAPFTLPAFPPRGCLPGEKILERDMEKREDEEERRDTGL